MTAETGRTFVAPLFGFDWQGAEIQLAGGFWIKTIDPEPIFQQHSRTLSEQDVKHCKRGKHWLYLELPPDSDLGEAEIMNLFLLALWAYKPTQTLLAYRFQIKPTGSAVRLLDRFAGEPLGDSEVTDVDLKVVATYLSVLKELTISSPRAKSSLLLNLHGCMAHSWQVAFVCLAAALESALTYFEKGEKRITERLARAYVAVIDPATENRDVIREEFKRLYDVRSRLVHEAAYRRENSQENLDDLAKLVGLLRDLWKAACSSDEIRQYIGGENSYRERVLQSRGGLLENQGRQCCVTPGIRGVQGAV